MFSVYDGTISYSDNSYKPNSMWKNQQYFKVFTSTQLANEHIF